MALADAPDATVPPHVEHSLRSILELHAKHDRSASLYERGIARLTDALGRPLSIGIVLTLILAWIAGNALVRYVGGRPIDPFPFAFLQGSLTALALVMTLVILTSQRLEDRLAEERLQMTLQLAIVSDQKLAKIIALVELQRRDNIHMPDREDDEASAMSEPTDALSMLDAVRETRDGMSVEITEGR